MEVSGGMYNSVFWCYAYHQQKIEDFINALAASPDPNDYSCQCEAAEYAKLNLDDLTSDNIKYIEREVAKRY